MHHDVSAGNVLIFPEIVRLSNGGYAVGMKGLLSDWELAKVIPEAKSALFASQPERIVSIFGSYAINGNQSLPSWAGNLAVHVRAVPDGSWKARRNP